MKRFVGERERERERELGGLKVYVVLYIMKIFQANRTRENISFYIQFSYVQSKQIAQTAFTQYGVSRV